MQKQGQDKLPASAAIYTNVNLRLLYDLAILSFSNTWVWRCSTKSVLLPFFQDHVANSASNHLDVGVGTGYYLVHSAEQLAHKKNVVLMDVNENPLSMATRRLLEATSRVKKDNDDMLRVQGVLHDVTRPWDRPAHLPPFGSISLLYLLHCLPGRSIGEKVDAVCGALCPHLEPESGILFGATILGDEAGHNLIGRLLMYIYNAKGYFGNRNDKESDLRDSLAKHFESVDVRRRGKVVLFTARGPRVSLTE